jgi:DNA-directed RNA polymerase beta subunit
VEKKNINIIKKKYKSIDEDGLPKVGHFVSHGEIYINKKTPIVTTEIKGKLKSLNFTHDDIEYIDRPAVLKTNTPLAVDKVIVTSSDQH